MRSSLSLDPEVTVSSWPDPRFRRQRPRARGGLPCCHRATRPGGLAVKGNRRPRHGRTRASYGRTSTSRPRRLRAPLPRTIEGPSFGFGDHAARRQRIGARSVEAPTTLASTAGASPARATANDRAADLGAGRRRLRAVPRTTGRLALGAEPRAGAHRPPGGRRRHHQQPAQPTSASARNPHGARTERLPRVASSGASTAYRSVRRPAAELRSRRSLPASSAPWLNAGAGVARPISTTRPSTCKKIRYSSRSDMAAIMPP